MPWQVFEYGGKLAEFLFDLMDFWLPPLHCYKNDGM
jgi:hypothetical protein